MTSNFKVLMLVLLLAGLFVAAWMVPLPGKAGRTLHADDKLVIISPHWDGIRAEFGKGFGEWYASRTGRSIAVEWLDQGGTSDDVRYVLSEFKRSPDGIGIDLFFGGGTDPFLKLQAEGLLQPVSLDSAILSAIPHSFSGIHIRDTAHTWFGAALSGFGIVYNKWVVERLGFAAPEEWRDLADPKYNSWIGAADPRNSGTMHLMFEIILQAYGWQKGWEILTGLAANTKAFAKGANEVPKMVARGDAAFGLAIDFYGWAQVSEAGEDRVGFMLPQNLTIVSADAIAMLKGAPHAQAARMFLEFVLAEEGQKLWFLKRGMTGGPETHELNRMSVLPGFYDRFHKETNIQQNPFAAPNSFRFDHKKASRRWVILNDLIGVGLVDHGKELRAARRLGRSLSRGGGLKAVPVSEATCDSLAMKEWKDPIQKNRILLGWHAFFADKYRRILKEK